MKRYMILAACVVMLMALGTAQAWSVFIEPLKRDYGFSSLQMQLIFATSTLFFSVMLIFGGRLQDRLGPRPLACASAVMLAGAYWMASIAGAHYFWLWLGAGVLVGTGMSVGYVSPIATAMKWFPQRQGLVAGVMAAAMAVGPIIVSMITEMCLKKGWGALEIFGLIGTVYPVVILGTGLMLATPKGQPGAAEVAGFRRSTVLRDRRFWTLFAGMMVGTLPYLLVMGCAKPMGDSFGIGRAAAMAVGALALGNAVGRVFWGYVVDRAGTRRSMLSAQGVMIASMAGLMWLGPGNPTAFLIAAAGVGSCYGSNFAIHPATASRLYGTHVLGTVYPMIMAAQAVSAMASAVNGWLVDRSGSYTPGLAVAATCAVLGLGLCAYLSRPMGGLVEDKRG